MPSVFIDDETGRRITDGFITMALHVSHDHDILGLKKMPVVGLTSEDGRLLFTCYQRYSHQAPYGSAFERVEFHHDANEGTKFFVIVCGVRFEWLRYE